MRRPGSRSSQRAALAVVALACLPRGAHAQTPGETALGRAEFELGVAAARRDAWAEALDHFARARALLPAQPLVALNLASAQTRTGRLVEAAASYRAFLRESGPASSADARAQATDALARVERRCPRVTLRARGLAPGDAVELDGQTIARAALDAPLPADPGEHALGVRRGTREVARATFHLDEGDARDVDLTAPPPLLLRVALAPDGPHPRPRAPGVVASPWFWVGTGAAVLVVAGAVVASVLLAPGAPTLGTVPVP